MTGNARDGAPIHIALKLGVGAGNPNDLMLETRSIVGILRAVADLVEVPEKDVTAGVVTPNESPLLASAVAFRIRSSGTFPTRSTVAVEHRGSWFYLDDADLASKAIFQAVEAIFQSRLAEATGAGRGTPVLTLPVR